MRSTIICVDDEKILLNVLAEQLETWFGNNYTIEKALGGEDALEILDDCIAQGIDVCVVISDYIMPKMKGDELLEKVKDRDPSIRKIMLTGYSAIEGIISAINRAGLYRYITKPWDNRDLMLTIIEAIKSYEQEKTALSLSKKFEQLYHTFLKSSNDLEATLDTAVEAFAYAVETRDATIMGHSRRVKQNSVLMGKALDFSKEDLRALQYAAFLHDIGKVSLEDEELFSMNKSQLEINATETERLLEKSDKMLSKIKDFDKVSLAVKYQMENYDGSGIFGLTGDEIPPMSRVLRITNHYDLVKNNIHSKQKISQEEVIRSIQEGKGSLFDPIFAEKFIELIKV